MLPRDLEHNLISALANVPIVAMVGPKQVGKTTLAFQIAERGLDKKTSYLDLN
jgi:uncharacterized protein